MVTQYYGFEDHDEIWAVCRIDEDSGIKTVNTQFLQPDKYKDVLASHIYENNELMNIVVLMPDEILFLGYTEFFPAPVPKRINAVYPGQEMFWRIQGDQIIRPYNPSVDLFPNIRTLNEAVEGDVFIPVRIQELVECGYIRAVLNEGYSVDAPQKLPGLKIVHLENSYQNDQRNIEQQRRNIAFHTKVLDAIEQWEKGTPEHTYDDLDDR